MNTNKIYKDWWSNKTDTGSQVYACNCIGPQNGEPLCPCKMRNIKIIDGRYIEIIDHGEAPKK